ncbi:hypothetical protein G6F35_016164 [Rhizopus arrhizus]|nr:hypothetical protein G6F35_016164 [Rhizopus arrhizus]
MSAATSHTAEGGEYTQIRFTLDQGVGVITLNRPDRLNSFTEVMHAELARALDAELPIVAAPRRRSPLRYGLSGLAVAAAVATVAWVAQPYLTGTPATEVRVLADASGTPASADDAGLRDYLEAHRQMAGPSAVRQVSFDVGAGR